MQLVFFGVKITYNKTKITKLYTRYTLAITLATPILHTKYIVISMMNKILCCTQIQCLFGIYSAATCVLNMHYIFTIRSHVSFAAHPKKSQKLSDTFPFILSADTCSLESIFYMLGWCRILNVDFHGTQRIKY